jgi:hypothetical protein
MNARWRGGPSHGGRGYHTCVGRPVGGVGSGFVRRDCREVRATVSGCVRGGGSSPVTSGGYLHGHDSSPWGTCSLLLGRPDGGANIAPRWLAKIIIQSGDGVKQDAGEGRPASLPQSSATSSPRCAPLPCGDARSASLGPSSPSPWVCSPDAVSRIAHHSFAFLWQGAGRPRTAVARTL